MMRSMWRPVIQRLGGLEHRQELRLIQVVPLDVGIDDHGLEAELADATLHFLHGIGRIVRGDRHHACVAVRETATGFGQLIVGIDGEAAARGRIKDLHARGGERNDLVVDAAGIHVRNALRTQVMQAVEDELGAGAGAARIETPQAAESRVVETAVCQQAAEAGADVPGEKGFFSSNAPVGGIFCHQPVPQLPRPKVRYLSIMTATAATQGGVGRRITSNREKAL
jgi:hypothetical protein